MKVSKQKKMVSQLFFKFGLCGFMMLLCLLFFFAQKNVWVAVLWTNSVPRGNALHHPITLQEFSKYFPSESEKYVVAHANELGYDVHDRERVKPTCTLWTNGNLTISQKLNKYVMDLKTYSTLCKKFSGVEDVRKLLKQGMSPSQVCQKTELHEQGLSGIFRSGQLSSGRFGKIEPLLPPLRHPGLCFERHFVMSLEYLVHDFGNMCRKTTSTSRNVMIDLGASLDFHNNRLMPAVFLADLFRKFGFPFDHIYAFEIDQKDPVRVFKSIPLHLLPAFHWMNIPVDANFSEPSNHLLTILNSLNEDDLVVIKLDIDNPLLELSLIGEMISNSHLRKIVDHIYFEHHVTHRDMMHWWVDNTNGSVLDSIKLFQELRSNGIAAHSWI